MYYYYNSLVYHTTCNLTTYITRAKPSCPSLFSVFFCEAFHDSIINHLSNLAILIHHISYTFHLLARSSLPLQLINLLIHQPKTASLQSSSLVGLRTYHTHTGTLPTPYSSSFELILVFLLICICIAIASLSLLLFSYPTSPIDPPSAIDVI